jgi:hypothetical protein
MRKMAKIAIGTALLCGGTIAAAAPAAAQVSFGVGIGAPAVRAPAPYTCYDYNGRPYYSYDPYTCQYQPYAYAAPAPQSYFGMTWNGRRDYDDRDREFDRDRRGDRRDFDRDDRGRGRESDEGRRGGDREHDHD